MQHMRTETKSLLQKFRLGRKGLSKKSFPFRGGKMHVLCFEMAPDGPKWLRGQMQ